MSISVLKHYQALVFAFIYFSNFSFMFFTITINAGRSFPTSEPYFGNSPYFSKNSISNNFKIKLFFTCFCSGTRFLSGGNNLSICSFHLECRVRGPFEGHTQQCSEQSWLSPQKSFPVALEGPYVVLGVNLCKASTLTQYYLSTHPFYF